MASTRTSLATREEQLPDRLMTVVGFADQIHQLDGSKGTGFFQRFTNPDTGVVKTLLCVGANAGDVPKLERLMREANATLQGTQSVGEFIPGSERVLPVDILAKAMDQGEGLDRATLLPVLVFLSDLAEESHSLAVTFATKIVSPLLHTAHPNVEKLMQVIAELREDAAPSGPELPQPGDLEGR